jgi:flavin-dependent thymidylate synthase
MKVILGGYNLDGETIDQWQAARPEAQDLTPETVAAAYARISRSPKAVNELRRIARQDVEKARKSNTNIVFDMGHSSIAEHAVFNIDMVGVSRLAIEEIEKFRLASYTEKSQRYVLFQDDFVIPEEIAAPGLRDEYIAAIRDQNRFYHELYAKLRPYVFSQHEDLTADPANRSTLEGWAKEDARYIISLATETQLGMTINARNLELTLRRLAAHPLQEVNRISRELFNITRPVAPSLIRYTEPTDYDRLTKRAIRDWLISHDSGLLKEDVAAEARCENPREAEPEAVRLVRVTPQADDIVAASLVYAVSSQPMDRCLEAAAKMTVPEKEDLVKAAFRYLKAHDAVLREFEFVDMQFELVISASCFAQMKRHRMATITCQDYDPDLGVTVPPAIAAVGMEEAFRDIVRRTEVVYRKIRDISPEAAPYILTNAHRKRVAMKVNARELYHIARLRADRHAQWDIRRIAASMTELGRQAMPLALMLAAGKDGFAAQRGLLFPPGS